MKAGLKRGVLRVVFRFCISPVTVGAKGATITCLSRRRRGTAKRWKEQAGTIAENIALSRADMESALTEIGFAIRIDRNTESTESRRPRGRGGACSSRRFSVLRRGLSHEGRVKSGVLRVVICFCKSSVTVGTQGGYYYMPSPAGKGDREAVDEENIRK